MEKALVALIRYLAFALISFMSLLVFVLIGVFYVIRCSFLSIVYLENNFRKAPEDFRYRRGIDVKHVFKSLLKVAFAPTYDEKIATMVAIGNKYGNWEAD